MDQLARATFACRDARRAERLGALETMLLAQSTAEPSVAVALVQCVPACVDLVDVEACHRLLAACRGVSWAAVLEAAAPTLPGPGLLWAVAAAARLVPRDHAEERARLAALVPMRSGSELAPLCAVRVELDPTLATDAAALGAIVAWCGSAGAWRARDESEATYYRSCDAVARALDRLWSAPASGADHLLLGLRAVFTQLSSPAAVARPQSSFAVALLAAPESVCAVATQALLAAGEAAVVTTMEELVQMPLRGTVAALACELYDALCVERQHDALRRITAGPTLACLTLQLYSPLCRTGALALLERLLCGFQAKPDAFHAVLPALPHLLAYLREEHVHLSAISASASEKREWMHALPHWRALERARALLALDTPPVFDGSAARMDCALLAQTAESWDVRAQVSRLVCDQAQLHAGFYSSLYAPVVRTARAIVGPYQPDVAALRRLGACDERRAAAPKPHFFFDPQHGLATLARPVDSLRQVWPQRRSRAHRVLAVGWTTWVTRATPTVWCKFFITRPSLWRA